MGVRDERWVWGGLVAACAAATTWIVLFAVRNDTAMSTDSESFSETARRLADGRGFGPTLVGVADAQPFATEHFPPGLPIVLSVLLRLGVPLLMAALLVNLASWVATLAGCVVLYRRAGGTPGIWLAAALLWVALCGTVVSMNETVWSEPLFLALSVWCLIAGERWIRGAGWRWGLLAVALAAAALSVRYVGICLVAALGVRVLQEGGGVRRVVGRGAAVAASIVPMVLWYSANRDGSRVDAPGVSDQPISLTDVQDSVGSLGAIVLGGIEYARTSRMFGPLDPVVRPLVFLVGAAAMVAAVLGLLRWWRNQGASTSGRLAGARAGGQLLVVDYVVLSTAFLFAYRILSGFSILSRYWIVVIVPVVPVLAAAASKVRALRWRPGSGRAAVPFAVGGFLAANLVFSLYFVAV